mmetsp:Transcript_31857/g.75600  ORF Transcript_31857/g.75600 Transcript_31857/m.75600 type:complete len:548 (-) Transcript_31857:60-1703(-)
MVNLPLADLVTGCSDFQGHKLNMLQVGLGTFGTFIQNLTVPDEVFPGVSWLLNACTDGSKQLRAIGVEPVPEHADRLRPLLQGLPGAALVQAAVSAEERNVEVHAITPKCYEDCVQELLPKQQEAFDFLVSFLRNMSCVDRAHPELLRFNAELEEQCGVQLRTEAISAKALTYGALARMLHFRGVEVLLIDAEGYDCKILQSMIDHCAQTKGDEEWPEIIQFETMGHSNWMKDSDQEAAMCRTLEGHGYTVACHGTDTQLVREAALASEPRLQTWIHTFRCRRCRTEGREGMPFSTRASAGLLCFSCGSLMRAFGQPVFSWETLAGEPRLASLSSNGTALFGVDLRGRACRYQDGRWERFGGGLTEVAASRDAADVFGIDAAGSVYWCARRSAGSWRQLHGSPALAHVAVAGDGSAVWGTDRQGRIYVYRVAARRWRRVRGWLRQLSVSHDGMQIWAVNPHGEVFSRYGGRTAEWLAVPGLLRQVAVSGDGRHVWGVNDNNEVYYRQGYWGHWAKVPGALTQVCSAEDSSTVWGTDTSSHVWAFCCS